MAAAVESVAIDAAIQPANDSVVLFEKLEPEFGIQYGKVQLWRLQRAGKFPLAIKLTDGGRVAWWRSEIVAWLRSRPRALRIQRPPAEACPRRRSRRG